MLGPIVTVTILCVSLWFLHLEFVRLRPEAIIAHVASIPLLALLASAGCAAVSYFVLTGYDAMAMRYIGRAIAYRHTAATAFTAYAVGHSVGMVALSGGSIRYRMYSSLGLSASEIARIVVFATVTFGLGASLLLGVALLLMPTADTAILKVSPALLHTTGMLLLATPLIYMLIVFARRTPLSVGAWRLALPRPAVGFAQIGLSVVDLMFATASLYVLLAADVHTRFLPFLGIYLLAMAAGLISGVPGGLGVFEAVLLVALPQVDRGVLFGAIIAYRLIYYAAPLGLAALLLAGHEIAQHRQALRGPAMKAGQWMSAAAPPVVAIALFLAGIVLLISGSTPAVESRLNWIAKEIPLPVLELSHLTGSVLGISLLILARGLSRRLRGAYFAALALLGGGILVSLLKGLDYEEALVLSAILGLLWVSRREYYRQGSLSSQRFPPGWVASIVLSLCVAIWVGLASFRHVDYSDQLWWQFALHADAPRMLRASVVAGVTAMGFAVWRLLRAGPASPEPDSVADMQRVRQIVRGANDPSANAALLDDKRFMWSQDRDAFIMYQLSGNSWIALGDPVGPPSARENLVWAFREMVDRYDGRPVFYQVSDESLPLYVDMGLALAKLGEDARVSLQDFSLEGSQRAELRQAFNRGRRERASFEVVPSAEIKTIVSDLREVSDAWLEDKAVAEKGFSLGFFSEQYISQFDCAVVRIDSSIAAFANLWPAPAGGELSIDLMRYNALAPKGIMDYLFAELMLWGKARKYAWLNLGMAPLSGLEQRTLAPLWHKIGHLIFSQADSLYHFEGLRRYKEKFDPEWRPRYIACPGGLLNLPRALLDTSRLISGGMTRLVSK